MIGQIENVQRELNIKEVGLKHLTLQLELLATQNAAHVGELQDQIGALKVRHTLLIVFQIYQWCVSLSFIFILFNDENQTLIILPKMPKSVYIIYAEFLTHRI